MSFKQNGKKFFRIGEKKPICVVPDIFASEIRINIREYYTPLLSSESDSEEKDQSFLYPTKKGVSLTLGEFETLCANIKNVKVQVSRLKKKTADHNVVEEEDLVKDEIEWGGYGPRYLL